jgi:hypothetical protein
MDRGGRDEAMQPSQLPQWVLCVQALAPTVVAIVAAFIASVIALRQWRTAHDRLSFDIFQKRFAVYEATKTLINRAAIHGQFTPDDLGEFYNAIRGAEFLFDGETRTLLMSIGDKAFTARMRRAQINRQPNHPSLDTLIDEEENILDFLRDQDRNLEGHFSRYLDLSKVGLRQWAHRSAWKTICQRLRSQAAPHK